MSPLKYTWAPLGQTPVVRTLITHHKRVNAIGAVCVSPKGRRLRLVLSLQRRNVTGIQIIAFLHKLLDRVQGTIVLVWDNHPIHRRKIVKAFIESQKRLHIESFPSYAPELNPAEGIWTQATEQTAGTAPRDVTQLHTNVYRALQRTAKSQKLMRACIAASAIKLG